MTIETREYVWVNDGVSFLTDDLAPDATSMTVLDGSLFPAPSAGQVRSFVLIDQQLGKYEIVYQTGRSGNVLTIERGMEDTAAQAWYVNQKVRASLTAGYINQFVRAASRLRIFGFVSDADGGAADTYSVTVDPSSLEIRPGDLLYFVGFAQYASVTADSQTTCPAGWNPIWPFGAQQGVSNAFTNTFGSSRQPMVAWKYVEDGEGASSFTAGNNAVSVTGICYVFRNPREYNPIASFKQWTRAPNDADCPFDTRINHVEDASSMLAATFWMMQTDAWTGVEYSDAAVDTHRQQNTASTDSDTLAVVWQGGLNEQENLLTHGRLNFNSNWTLTGLATGNDTSGNNSGGEAYSQFTCNTTPGLHGVSKTVELVAGQQYTLMVSAGGRTNSSGVDWPAYAYITDGVDEFGMYWSESAGAPTVGTYGTPDDTFTTLNRAGATSGDGVRAVNYRHIVFTALTTGTHTIHIGLPNSSYTRSWNGSSNYGLGITCAVLARGRFPMTPTGDLMALGSQRLAVQGMRPRALFPTETITATSYAMLMAEIADKFAEANESRFQHNYPSVSDDPAAGVYNTTRRASVRKSNSSESEYLVADRHCYPPSWGGPGKFYVEAYWENLNGGSPSVVAFLVTTVDDIAGLTQAGVAATKGYGFEAITSELELRLGTGADGGTYKSPYNNLDTLVGVAVDYVNEEVSIYKDGVLVTTTPLLEPDLPMFIAMKPGFTNSPQRGDVVLNTTGPFDAKPMGFSAWDWENEVLS